MIDIVLSTVFTKDFKKSTILVKSLWHASGFGDFLKLIICLFSQLISFRGQKKPTLQAVVRPGETTARRVKNAPRKVSVY